MSTDPNDVFAEAQLREIYSLQRNWDALENLYGERERWHALLSIFSHFADDTADEMESAELLIRMARICSESLGNETASMECWERLLEKQPDHPEAISTLAPFYETEARWEDLVGVIEARLSPARPVCF